MKKALILAKDEAKQKIKENATKLVLVGAGIAALSTAYFTGKSKGKVNLKLLLYSAPEDGKQTLIDEHDFSA